MNIPWRKLLIGELSWKRLFKSLGFIYGALVLIGLFFSDHIIFPYRGSSYDQNLPGLQMLDTSQNLQIATRYLKSPREQSLILHFHGNYEDLGQLSPIYETLQIYGFSILAMDYRGYGLSEGNPAEQGCYEDAQALYQQAITLGYNPENIIIWGRSVGSGLAVKLALREKAGALVLESPFSTAFRVSTRIPLVPFDKFHNLKKIASIEEPLFILHGDRDTVIPGWHSKKLYDRHQGPKERHLIRGAGHNNLWSFSLDDTLEALIAFQIRSKS